MRSRRGAYCAAFRLSTFSILTLVAAIAIAAFASGAMAADAAVKNVKVQAPVAPTATTKTAVTAPAVTKTAATAPGVAKPAVPKSSASIDKPAPVTTGQQLSFDQEKILAEMAELEERMFRLSESLSKLEPDNASRLKIALKYAREELILNEMKQTREVLNKLMLNEAVKSQKDLVAKLERLQLLLLSTDLDLRLKVERARLLREVLKRLEVVIKEQEREKRLSEIAAADQRKLDGLRKRQVSLGNLIKRQTEHLETSRDLIGKPSADAAKKSETGKLAADQQKTRQDTLVLAKVQDAAKPSKNLDDAADKMEKAEEKLAKNDVKEATPPMEQALDALKKDLAETDKQAKALAAKVDKQQFAMLRKDQEGTRQSTDNLAELVQQLADSGAAAMSDLTRASGNMSSAEGMLGRMNASGAGGDQDRALASLKNAREQLEDELERLLDEVRADLKQKVIETLTWMLEQQTEIRKSTVALGGRAKGGSRLALNSIVALGKSEEKMVTAGEELIGLVEETEYGIALPAALTSVRDAMEEVRLALDAGNASASVVQEEKEIEADLKGLIDAMQQLPTTGGNQNGKGNNGGAGRGDPQRQINRMVAELKMVRLLQLRVNRGTSEADHARPTGTAALPADVRKKIEDLGGRQEDIRDVTERLATERNLREQ